MQYPGRCVCELLDGVRFFYGVELSSWLCTICGAGDPSPPIGYVHANTIPTLFFRSGRRRRFEGPSNGLGAVRRRRSKATARWMMLANRQQVLKHYELPSRGIYTASSDYSYAVMKDVRMAIQMIEFTKKSGGGSGVVFAPRTGILNDIAKYKRYKYQIRIIEKFTYIVPTINRRHFLLRRSIV